MRFQNEYRIKALKIKIKTEEFVKWPKFEFHFLIVSAFLTV